MQIFTEIISNDRVKHKMGIQIVVLDMSKPKLVYQKLCEIQPHFGPSRLTYNMGYGPPTVYISGVNGARMVKSDLQVAMNKNSDPVQIFFP